MVPIITEQGNVGKHMREQEQVRLLEKLALIKSKVGGKMEECGGYICAFWIIGPQSFLFVNSSSL